MILQALYDYYQRKAADPDGKIAPEGFEDKEIHFICQLDHHGNFLRFEDTRTLKNGKLRAAPFRVPSLGESKGSGIKANLLWENAEYMFGFCTKETSKKERVAAQAAAFRKKIRDTFGASEKAPWRDVLNFLDNLPVDRLQMDPLWQEVMQPSSLVVLGMDMFGILAAHPDVSRAVQSSGSDEDGGIGYCLVTGEISPIKKLLPPIRGVRGANPTGGSLVAVNNKVENGRNQGETPAFASYMKSQGYNSPIGEAAADAFSKALNDLLGRDSSRKVQVGDSTTIFWSEKKTPFEEDFPFFWSASGKDDPDRGVRAVETLLKSPFTGAAIPESDVRFFILGLAPNSARIAVRYWHTGTIAEISGKIRQHFLDLKIVESKGDRGSYALFFLLSDIAVEGKADNIPPNLAGDVMRSILTGGPYPASLLQQAVRRIRAKQTIRRTQAATLKAYLNRQNRLRTNSPEEEITMALDSTNTNPGYRLGRLFAALEKIQEDAQRGINTTIRDRFYGAASSSPVTVFPQLLKLKNHHLSKLENPAFRVVHEKRLSEIFDGLSATMPPHLSMEDQARFAVGYYHQRQAFFTNSEKNE